MRAVVQRVKNASVTVDGTVTGAIRNGLLVYLGVANKDDEIICLKMANKIAKLRIFEDEDEKMNLSVQDVGGSILVVSQFTLYANLHKGNRPSYDEAGEPKHAEKLYEYFLKVLTDMNFETAHGIFGAHMHVEYENDGPVTILMDSNDLFLKNDLDMRF